MEKKKVPIEVIIGKHDAPELHIVGMADEKIVDQSLKFFGLRYTEPQKTTIARATCIDCKDRYRCTDYPDKCAECLNNHVGSFFVAKGTKEETKNE